MDKLQKRLDVLEASLTGLEQATSAMARRAEREYLEHRKQLAVRKAKREVFDALIAAAEKHYHDELRGVRDEVQDVDHPLFIAASLNCDCENSQSFSIGFRVAQWLRDQQEAMTDAD